MYIVLDNTDTDRYRTSHTVADNDTINVVEDLPTAAAKGGRGGGVGVGGGGAMFGTNFGLGSGILSAICAIGGLGAVFVMCCWMCCGSDENKEFAGDETAELYITTQPESCGVSHGEPRVYYPPHTGWRSGEKWTGEAFM